VPMAVTPRRFTVDEIFAWPYDGNRYELVDGVLLVTPGPIPVHQIIASRILIALESRVRRWPHIRVAGPADIILRPRTYLQPDVMVFDAPSIRTKWEQVRAHWLAVEVFGPSSKVFDREIKRDAYLQLGVREVWLVDLDQKVVYASRQEGPRDVPHLTSLPWRPPPVPVPPPLDLAEIFRELD
jgi:Uma2 family endonuclease